MIDANGFILENQLELPFLGFDTKDLKAEHLLAAIEAGYRHFLLAPNGENAPTIRKMLQACPLPRRELFLTMELDMQKNLPQEAEHILQQLDTPYFDLLLLRQANGDILQNWQAMEELSDVGAAHGIGTSGFRPQMLLPLLGETKVRPIANLLPFAPMQTHPVTAAFCLSHGIQLLAQMGNPALLTQIPLAACAEKYGRSAMQIWLRFALQNNILPLIQAEDAAQMQTAQEIFDFDLSSEDFYTLLSLGE